MRIAVLSDVHANLHALEAVLAEVDAGSFDAIWCLGDLVGYGPKPNECVALLQERAAICLAGNHDLVVLGKIPIEAFAGEAGAAARWTQTVLDEPARAFLDTLAPKAAAPGAELFHGSPRDPVWEYVLTEAAAASALELTEGPLVLVGHSHVALEISNGGDLRGGQAPAGTQLELGRRGDCSTRARSASPATATPARPGSRLTLRQPGQPSAVPTIRSSRRNASRASWVSPRSWQHGSTTASSPALTETEQHG